MSTRVVNLREDPDYDFYIGRAGRGHDGYFGNPYRVGKRCRRCGDVHARGGDTLACFRGYFEERLLVDAEFRRRVHGLQGWTLGCFCKPAPCHGDVIAEYVDSLTHAELGGPRRRRGARERRVRSDVAALALVNASRALNRAWRHERGAQYVIPGNEDEPFEIWAVRRGAIVLRSTKNLCGYLVLTDAPDPRFGYWR